MDKKQIKNLDDSGNIRLIKEKQDIIILIISRGMSGHKTNVTIDISDIRKIIENLKSDGSCTIPGFSKKKVKSEVKSNCPQCQEKISFGDEVLRISTTTSSIFFHLECQSALASTLEKVYEQPEEYLMSKI